MLSKKQMLEASDLLVSCWREGRLIAELPERLRPQTRAEGYGIQEGVMRHTAHSLFGWKIAATSLAGQQHVKVSAPFAGRILQETVRENGGNIPVAGSNMSCLELEFAFRFGRDLPPRKAPYGLEEVMAAVDALFPALEAPDSRFADFSVVGGPQLIADNGCAAYFILGPQASFDWRGLNLAEQALKGRLAGREEWRHGRGANVLGDPRVALTRLVNDLSEMSTTLRAGEIVTTGTCIDPIPVKPGDKVEADFGLLGTMSALCV